MANYTVPSPSTTTQGTESNDTFLLQTALRNTVFGNGGNDVISAQNGEAKNYASARFNLGEGNDTLALSAGTGGKASFLAGAGNDKVSADGFTFTSLLLQGGGGNDTVSFSAATASNSTIGGNAGADLISASAGRITTSQILLGGGNDTLALADVGLTGTSIQGGGGSDVISASFSAKNGVEVLGDVVGSEFYGNDQITLSAAAVNTSFNAQGAGGADTIQLFSVLGSASTVNGNYGKDSIFLSAAGGGYSALIAGGAGKDTITITAVNTGVTNYGTVNGGGGNDLITIDGVADNTGASETSFFVVGGAGADTILLEIDAAGSGGQNTAFAYAKYTDASESNLTTTDVISAFDATQGNAQTTGMFVVTQSIASASVLTDNVAGKYTVTNGVISGGEWAGTEGDITARLTYLDTVVAKGTTVAVEDNGGDFYLFVQGGAAGSGTADDLVIKLGNNITAVTEAGGSAIKIEVG